MDECSGLVMFGGLMDVKWTILEGWLDIKMDKLGGLVMLSWINGMGS